MIKHPGFSSPRLPDADEADDKETGVVKQAIEGLRKEIGAGTLGQYLHQPSDKAPPRRRYLGRDMVTAEFDRLWAAQALYHTAMTEELRSQLWSAAFYRRPIYWRLDTLGRCRFVPGSPLCGTGSWIGQQSIMLEKLNSLRLAGGNARELDESERAKALELFSTQRSVTFGGLRKALRLRKGQTFNFEVGGRDKLPGNATEAALIKIFGPAWDTMRDALKDRIRREIYDRVRDVYYARKGEHRIEIRTPEEVAVRRTALIATLQSDYELSDTIAEALADISLPGGWRRVSVGAVEAMLPWLEAGETYSRAVEEAFGVSHSAEPAAEMSLAKLPSRPEDMPDIRNPTVNRALNEVRKVVNNLLAHYGRPALIRVELARDLRLPKRDREAVDRKNQERNRERKKAAERLEECGIRDPDRTTVEKYLLWKETQETCPYTGKKIGFDQVFRTGEYEVEHIVPRSRPPFDNSFANKTLCEKQINIEKGDRTPFGYYRNRPEEWAKVKIIAQNVLKNANPAKYARFVREDLPDADALAERQLRDTAYIAVATRDFLKQLDGRPNPALQVETSNGRVTAQLRDLWGLNRILGDTGEKNRADHRHHAIDAAAVAMATPAIVKRLSDHYKMERRAARDDFPAPWPGFHHGVKQAASGVVVSHRTRRKVSGALHKQTNYGDTLDNIVTKGITYRLFVTRKPLDETITQSQIAMIRDDTVRKIVEDHIASHGATIKKAFPPYPKLPDGKGGWREIRKVRILIKQQMDLMVPLNSRTRAYADQGDNHHVEIFRSRDGTVRQETVSLFEAARRLSAGQMVIRRQSDQGDRLVMSLGPGDMLEFPGIGDQPPSYRVVTSVWAAGPIVLEDHTTADGTVWKRPSGASVLKAGARKVSVDPIGRVRPAND